MKTIKRMLVLGLCMVMALGAGQPAYASQSSGSETKQLKVLTIGNSFSEDAMTYLYPMLQAAGVTDIVLGNLYYPSCSLAMHLDNAKQDAPNYVYQKNSTGTWEKTEGATLLTGLKDENWDVIILQQVSGLSGMPDSYNEDLTGLVDYVKSNKTNPDAKLGWHMTWAYEGGSNHLDFPKYDSDQMKMYQAIVDTVQAKIVPMKDFDFVIPNGTTIQNIRTSYIGDKLTRDSYHMSMSLGRYVAGVTWLKVLTGCSLYDFDSAPGNTAGVPEEYWPMIQDSVENAVKTPFAVTASTFTEKPEVKEVINYDDYELLDWQPTGSSYWNSTDANNAAKLLTAEVNPSANNFAFFVSSGKMFTKEELPVGTILEVDDGYQYRPEGWIDLKTQGGRPEGTDLSRVVVDEAWWGDYQYRAFNVSAKSGADLSGAVEDTATHFRIYVPKGGAVSEEDYVLFDWQPTPSSYWFPLDTDYPTTLMTAEVRPEWNNYATYIGSARRFTREDLPVGTIIELDPGYIYLPEAWLDDNTQKVREDMVTDSKVVIDEAWWGDYTYRAINMFKDGASDISQEYEEVASHLRIYVPKATAGAADTEAAKGEDTASTDSKEAAQTSAQPSTGEKKPVNVLPVLVVILLIGSLAGIVAVAIKNKNASV